MGSRTPELRLTHLRLHEESLGQDLNLAFSDSGLGLVHDAQGVCV